MLVGEHVTCDPVPGGQSSPFSFVLKLATFCLIAHYQETHPHVLDARVKTKADTPSNVTFSLLAGRGLVQKLGNL